MSLVSLTLPSDGQTATAASVNNPFNALANVINGNLDSTNISSLSGTKIQAGTLPSTAFNTAAAQGWQSLSNLPNTVTYNGNRSYTAVFNGADLTSTLSPGDRVRFTRSSLAPTQSASFNGSTQFYNKTAPNGMTFTDDFTVSAWVKLTSYGFTHIVSRYNGTSGWDFNLQSNGIVQLIGFNAGAGNYSYIQSYQSIPLNKWVHVTAQLDMSSFTNSPTTSYIMIDGVDVNSLVARAGTNPTALVQAGNLEVGSYWSGANPFPGKIAQVAVYSSKVTQAAVQATISQGLSGSESNLISAYSLNNSINDLNTTNANNLTANGGVLATSNDSPFGIQGDGTNSSSLEYGILQKATFSTNTTATIQVPEGAALPTTGGVSAVSYSSAATPYQFPSQRTKWSINAIFKVLQSVGSPAAGTWYNINGSFLTIPAGEWVASHSEPLYVGGSGNLAVVGTLSTTNNGETDNNMTVELNSNGPSQVVVNQYKQGNISNASQVPYYFNVKQIAGTVSVIGYAGTDTPLIIAAENAYV